MALRSSLAGVVACGLAACSSPGGPAREATGRSAEAIVGGTVASSHTEAALLDLMEGGSVVAACSGAVIAPRVVLTAGHCVSSYSGWQILVPYAGGQTAMATHGAVLDWQTPSNGSVDPTLHDVGLVFLDAPLTMPAYPVLAKAPVADGSHVVNLGRIDSGQLSFSDMFQGPPVAVTGGSAYGYPYDYASEDIIQEGDSGGPVEVPGSSPAEIVAVNSGSGSQIEVMARVDVVYAWIQQQIQSHGGGGGESAPDAGGSTGSDDGGGDDATAGTGGGDDASTGDDGGNAESPGSGWVGPAKRSSGCSVGGRADDSWSWGALAVVAAAAARRRRPGGWPW